MLQFSFPGSLGIAARIIVATLMISMTPLAVAGCMDEKGANEIERERLFTTLKSFVSHSKSIRVARYISLPLVSLE